MTTAQSHHPVRSDRAACWRTLYGVIPGAVMLVWCAAGFQAVKSATYDETFYLSCARQTAAAGQLDPRLAQGGAAPLPVLLCHLPVAWRHPAQRIDPHRGQLDDPPLILAARRCNTWLVGVPMLTLVYAWLRLRRGPSCAFLATGFVALSPSITAHASLATTDLAFCLTAVLSLASLSWYARRPTVIRLVLSAVALGVAYAAKYSALSLFPIAAAVLLWRESAGEGSWLRRTLLAGTAVSAFFYIAWCATWALHGFAWQPLSRSVRGLPLVQSLGVAGDGISLPSPVTGLLVQMDINRHGHLAFLLGERRMTGWWQYYPCALWFKSTPAEVVIAAVTAALLVVGGSRRIRHRRLSHSDSSSSPTAAAAVDRWLWLASIILVLGLSMCSTINIGQRYVLLVYPLTIMLACDLAWARFPGRRTAIAALLLIAIQAWSTFSIAPHYLAYFSPLVGGPGNGPRLLSDSNLDWGQDLPLLRQTFRTVGAERPLICYFGTADPRAYGVHADRLNDDRLANLERYDWLAVSVGWLQGVCIGPHFDGPHNRTNRAVHRLFGHPPDARAGWSIYLYDLRDPEVCATMCNDESRGTVGNETRMTKTIE